MQVLATARNFYVNRRPQDLLEEAGFQLAPTTYGHTIDDSEISEDAMIELLQDAVGLIRGNARVSRSVIEACDQLKVISIRGVGYDGIDTEAAKEKGIRVTITPGAIDNAVAEYALALILAIARGIPDRDHALRDGFWKVFLGRELSDKTLGIVGLGRIGKALARRAVGGFNMEILAFNRSKDHTFAADVGVRYVELDELMATSDFISIHAPLSESTRGLIGEREIQLMKPSAYLINTARGPIVDESALIDALKVQAIAGAALDVFAIEPLGESPLKNMDNVIVTPHMAGYTREGLIRANTKAAENVIASIAGRDLTEGTFIV